MPRNPSEELLTDPDQDTGETHTETAETLAKRIEHLDELEHQVLAQCQANGTVLDGIKEILTEFQAIVGQHQGLLDRAQKLSSFADHLPTRRGRAPRGD